MLGNVINNCNVIKISGSIPWAILPPKGHWAMPGHILIVTTEDLLLASSESSICIFLVLKT